MSVTIYHNPRCSKSRQTLAILEEQDTNPTIVEYLKEPPSAAEIGNIVEQLGISVRELMRTGEDEYKAAKDTLAQMGDDELLTWLNANPKVIQRPIVLTDKGARIGRPPESVLEIL